MKSLQTLSMTSYQLMRAQVKNNSQRASQQKCREITYRMQLKGRKSGKCEKQFCYADGFKDCKSLEL